MGHISSGRESARRARNIRFGARTVPETPSEARESIRRARAGGISEGEVARQVAAGVTAPEVTKVVKVAEVPKAKPTISAPTLKPTQEIITDPSGFVTREKQVGIRGRVLRELVFPNVPPARELRVGDSRGRVERLQSRFETTAARGPVGFRTAGAAGAAFGIGIGLGVGRTAIGITRLFTSPIESAKGFVSFVRSPAEPLGRLGGALATRPAATAGEIFGSVGTSFLPGAGLSKLARTERVSRIGAAAKIPGFKATKEFEVTFAQRGRVQTVQRLEDITPIETFPFPKTGKRQPRIVTEQVALLEVKRRRVPTRPKEIAEVLEVTGPRVTFIESPLGAAKIVESAATVRIPTAAKVTKVTERGFERLVSVGQAERIRGVVKRRLAPEPSTISIVGEGRGVRATTPFRTPDIKVGSVAEQRGLQAAVKGVDAEIIQFLSARPVVRKPGVSRLGILSEVVGPVRTVPRRVPRAELARDQLRPRPRQAQVINPDLLFQAETAAGRVSVFRRGAGAITVPTSFTATARAPIKPRQRVVPQVSKQVQTGLGLPISARPITTVTTPGIRTVPTVPAFSGTNFQGLSRAISGRTTAPSFIEPPASVPSAAVSRRVFGRQRLTPTLTPLTEVSTITDSSLIQKPIVRPRQAGRGRGAQAPRVIQSVPPIVAVKSVVAVTPAFRQLPALRVLTAPRAAQRQVLTSQATLKTPFIPSPTGFAPPTIPPIRFDDVRARPRRRKRDRLLRERVGFVPSLTALGLGIVGAPTKLRDFIGFGPRGGIELRKIIPEQIRPRFGL